MDAVPTLPPYAHFSQEDVTCIAAAAARQGVPELLLHAILLKENGRVGKCAVPNKNGSVDCGLAQVNSMWEPYFGKMGVSPSLLKGNACVNVEAGAHILRTYYERKNQDWHKAIIAYNIGPNNWTQNRLTVGSRYAADVQSRWWALYDWVVANTSSSK